MTRLMEIELKLDAGERLDLEDGIALFEEPDLLSVGRLANRIREKRHGEKAFYVVNRHINYSNICKDPEPPWLAGSLGRQAIEDLLQHGHGGVQGRSTSETYTPDLFRK